MIPYLDEQFRLAKLFLPNRFDVGHFDVQKTTDLLVLSSH